FSAEAGTIIVTTTADVSAANGIGIHTNSVGLATTTIDVLSGTVQGGTSGITAESVSGAIQVNNSGTIQNMSGQPGDFGFATSGAGDATLTNKAGGVVTGSVAMTGTGANSFVNAGIWNTLGSSSFVGATSVVNSGTINVFGNTTFSGLTTLTNAGTLNLAV